MAHFLHNTDELLAFAGLYELWPDPQPDEDHSERWTWSYTILTSRAADSLGHTHDRSPVIIPAGNLRDRRLDLAVNDTDQVRDLLAAIPEATLEPREVPSAVNSPTNNGPELLDAV